MGVTPVEKAEFAAYQLKAESQILYKQWKEGRPEDASPLDLEKFMSAFLIRFLLFEIRQAKVLEFINLRQGSMSVREYALKFKQLSMYSPIMVVDSSAIEEKKLQKKSREVKRVKIDDGNFSHERSDGHSHSRFRQRFSGQGSSNAPLKFNKDKVSNPKTQGGNSNRSLLSKSTCTRYGRNPEGKCLADTYGSFSCGINGLKIRDFPMLMVKGIEGKQAPPSCLGPNAPKQN
ncbi:uncharacterized protein LOC125859017 [Solanum stenotomum]|uniref:uncharacterized protein LOC125859017 n=1 Tax=Solanum stenotomum TaxID=172797 RepID=UPI0020CFFA79|nr:uncharacterized protein LOC125859017 [Solanum stenotomum]